jgi:hypothetical protein
MNTLSTSCSVCGRGKPLYPSVRLPFPHNLTPVTNFCLNQFGEGCKIRSIFWSALVVSEPQGLVRLKVRLVQDADFGAVLIEELVHFQRPAANPVSIPMFLPQVFSPVTC